MKVQPQLHINWHQYQEHAALLTPEETLISVGLQGIVLALEMQSVVRNPNCILLFSLLNKSKQVSGKDISEK